jgi:hypothetical protein
VVPAPSSVNSFCPPSQGEDQARCRAPLLRVGRAPPGVQGSYLVDSASSHMLVSKIKPCMSKYKHSIL